MSNLVLCDIIDCENEASPREIDYFTIETEPTGHSDYSTIEVEKVKCGEFDLCSLHRDEYNNRIKKVVVFGEEGLYFPNE